MMNYLAHSACGVFPPQEYAPHIEEVRFKAVQFAELASEYSTYRNEFIQVVQSAAIWHDLDCYICPNNKILKYSTTNRDGYREYKSCLRECEKCPYLSQCTESKNHTKPVMRHI